MATGDFCWHELMTSDPKAAADFYAEAVGWTIKDSGMPGMDYLLGCIGDRQVVGIMAVPEDAARHGARPSWWGYVAVDDVDAAAAKVTDAGGAIHRQPGDIPGVGRFAVVADPQGAAFMLFRGEGEALPDLSMMTPGWPSWHELHTSDAEAGFAFYESQFGWRKDVAIPMGPIGIYQIFATSADPVGAAMNDGSAPHPYWLHYFTVDDIDAAIARIDKAGGAVLRGPDPIPGDAWVAHATDPQGAMFAITGLRR